MELQKYQKCSKVTRGLRKAEFVLKNARIVNVFTREILEGDIAIQDGMIVGIGNYQGEEETDLGGRYVCPGFIDSHLHLESTLVTPAELVTVASRHGTTTFIVDPHESANVSGLKGIDYILNQTEDVDANVFVMMPSCVPATAIDDNGCTLTAQDMEPYLSKKRILGLGEVMDYISVVKGDEAMHRKLELFSDKVRDGHAPFLSDMDLQAYAMAGIATDHECSDFAYAMRERRNGMIVHIREGSAARNLKAIVNGIVENQMNGEGFCFCTDDKHIEDIEKEGHIDHNVRKAIGLGMNPIDAICMATINSAKCYGLTHLGAIAPGYQADLLVVDNLEKMTIQDVYYKGCGGGSSTGITSGGVTRAAGPSMPSYVVTGTWMQNAAGQWMFADKERTYAKEWAAVHNPYASTADGQSAYDWFRFDENGFLVTGWYQDTDGNRYYLNPSPDGTQGRMLTGWNWIDGQCLYFEEESNGTRGALRCNAVLPDGKQTNEHGAWIVNGIVQRQETGV